MTNDKALTQKPKAEVPAVEKSPTAFLLEYPFRRDQVKKRPGQGGAKLDYIETASVIQRLNDALGFAGWSFDVVQETEANDEVIVKARLTVHIDGRDVLKVQYGSHPYTRKKNTDEIVSKGDTLKAAASDALKKCSSLLGVGLHLHGESYRSFRITQIREEVAKR
jgi:recombination DNA repair RAD52 pathway protein